MKFLNNQTILITGGTGSFGQNACEKLLKFNQIKKIIIFSRDENKQYIMQQRLKNKKLRFFLGDVRDIDRLLVAFKGVDYVIHAAALKHVPAAEYNPTECIKTNIDGSQSVITAAIERNIKKVIALSTDKACNPINLYGATKLCSEKLFINANQYSQNTNFAVVRYGNVIGSRGSVIPYFKSLAEEKKKLPLTSKDMTRFFILIDDAVKFVFKCLSISSGGEIFIPKMNSIKILDVIKIIDQKAKINISGIRPGEKLHEILFSKEEARLINEDKEKFIIYSQNLNYKKKFGKKVSSIKEFSSMDINQSKKKIITKQINLFLNYQ